MLDVFSAVLFPIDVFSGCLVRMLDLLYTVVWKIFVKNISFGKKVVLKIFRG